MFNAERVKILLQFDPRYLLILICAFVAIFILGGPFVGPEQVMARGHEQPQDQAPPAPPPGPRPQSQPQNPPQSQPQNPPQDNRNQNPPQDNRNQNPPQDNRNQNPPQDNRNQNTAQQDDRNQDTDQQDDRRPGTAQQDDRRPGTDQQDDRNQDIDQQDDRNQGTDQQDDRNQGTDQQDDRNQGTDQQDDRRPGTDQQDDRRPGTAQQDDRRPGTAQQDDRRPGTAQQDDRRAGTAQQDDRRPGTAQQDDRRPGTDQQDDRRPGTAQQDERVPEREDKRDSASTGLSGCMANAETAVARSACVSSARPQIQEFERERLPIVDRGENQQGVDQEGQGRDREGQEVRSDDANQGGGGQGQGGQAREGDQGDNRTAQLENEPNENKPNKPPGKNSENTYRGNDWSDKADKWVETTTEFDEDGNIMAIRKGQTQLDNNKFEDSTLTGEASTRGGALGPGGTADRSRETRRTAYDKDGNISIVLTTDREGNEMLTEYDSAGRITWKESRDAKGDLLSAEIPTGERGDEAAGRQEQCMQGRGGVASRVCDTQLENEPNENKPNKPPGKNSENTYRGSEEMKAPKRGSLEYDERLYGQDSGEVVLDKKGGIRRTQMVNPDGSLTLREFDADGEIISSNTLGARNDGGKFMSSTNDRLANCVVGQDAGECASLENEPNENGDNKPPGENGEAFWRASEGGGKYDDISDRLWTSEERGQGGEIKSRVLKYQGGEKSAMGINGENSSADAGTGPSAETMDRLKETFDGGGIERANAFTADEKGKLKVKSQWANRTAYSEDGQVDKVENFTINAEGTVSFGADDLNAKRRTADAASAQVSGGSEVSVSSELPSIKPRTGFSIKLDRGGRPVLAVSGESASNEGGISMDSGLDGFVLGFLPKYEKGDFDKKKGLNSRLDEEED